VPTRTVHTGDGVAFLAQPLPPVHAIVTSLPDHSEIPALGVDAWRAWFIATVAAACRAVDDDAVAIFFQTDVKHDGRWIDKGYLVMRGVEDAGSALLWHKIVCRAPAGTVTFGRPAYAHLICASRGLRLATGQSSADVLPDARRDAVGAGDGRRRVPCRHPVPDRPHRVPHRRRSVLRRRHDAGRRQRRRPRRRRRRAVAQARRPRPAPSPPPTCATARPRGRLPTSARSARPLRAVLDQARIEAH
jgi:hypothetical protein